MAADYYIEKENLFIVSERQKIRLVRAVTSLLVVRYLNLATALSIAIRLWRDLV